MEQGDLQPRIRVEECGNQLSDVRPDPPGSGVEELVDVERNRRHRCSGCRAASTHVTPSSPTVAACSVAGWMSSRSPGSKATSPSRVWNTTLPDAQYRTLWYSWACHPYVSPGPLDHHRMSLRPSWRNRAPRSSWLG